MTAEIIQISGITLASVVIISIHFHNKKLDKVKGQLENLYLRATCRL